MIPLVQTIVSLLTYGCFPEAKHLLSFTPASTKSLGLNGPVDKFRAASFPQNEQI